jgi:hypothetical protein
MLPYVDIATFVEAPTGIDTSQLVPAGTSPQNSAALQNLLERASSWVDADSYQRIAATTDSQIKRVRPNRQGQLEVYPKNFPIIQVLAAKWIDLSAGTAAEWTPITVANILALERSFLIYDQDYTYWRGMGTFPLQVQFQYTNGYPLTTLTGPLVGTSTIVGSGASTIDVASTVGIGTTTGAPGNWNEVSELTILDGATREIVEVTAINGTALTIASPTVNSHSVGALVTGVPPVVQEATILVATWMVQNPRGDASFVMSGSGSKTQKTPQTTDDDLLAKAHTMLTSFRRAL